METLTFEDILSSNSCCIFVENKGVMCFVEYFDLFMDLDVGADHFVADCTRAYIFF